VLLALALAAPAAADSIGITVIQRNYSVDLSASIFLNGSPLAQAAHTTTGPNPVSDSIAIVSPLSPLTIANAAGTADLFATHLNVQAEVANLVAGNPTSTATVAEQIRFTTSSSASANIGFAVTGVDLYTRGSLQLSDLTTSAVLWNYWWDIIPGDPVSGSNLPGFSLLVSSYTWDTTANFLANHLYELDMSSYGNANKDSAFVNETVSGLKPVPEPSTIALLILGGSGLVYRHRARGRNA